jgi:hypothetical protein
VPAAEGTRGAGSVVVVVGGLVVVVDVVIVVEVVATLLVVLGPGGADVVVVAPVVVVAVVVVELLAVVGVGLLAVVVDDPSGLLDGERANVTSELSPPASLHAATLAHATASGIRRARRRCRGVTAPMMPAPACESGSYRALKVLRLCSQRTRAS